MPFYNFTDKNTGETQQVYLKISELDQFLTDNPNLTQDVCAPLVSYSPTAAGDKKPPGWFRDKVKALDKVHKYNKLQTW